MFNIDFELIVNKKTYNNPAGRRLLYDLENKGLEVDFYIGDSGVFVIENEL